MSLELVFEPVWYRERNRRTPPSQAAWDDIGSLSIQDGEALFSGGRHTLRMDRLLDVRRSWARRDFFNRWVLVTYRRRGEVREARFHDGGIQGWRGKFGGNRRIYDALKRAVRPTGEDEAHD
jgi:hypothetical protein